jgi:hypothetical protein
MKRLIAVEYTGVNGMRYCRKPFIFAIAFALSM